MTTITFFKQDDIYKGFTAEGHAGFDDYGKDIVCASISVLIVNTINAISEINHEDIECAVDEDEGVIIFNLLSNKEQSSQVLLKALELGLNGIHNEYGKGFISIITKEVNDYVKA